MKIHHFRNRGGCADAAIEGCRAAAAILADHEAGRLVFSLHVIPGIGGGARDERLDEVNPEEAKEVDEGGDEGDNGGEF